MSFSDPHLEAAGMGYIGMLGFGGIAAADLLEPHEWTDSRFIAPYAAALHLHRAGRVVNQFTITDHLRESGVPREFKQAFHPVSWEAWYGAADLQFTRSISTAGITGAMRELRRLYLKRRAHEIIRQGAGGEIEPEEVAKGIAETLAGPRLASLATLLESRRFDASKPPPHIQARYLIRGKALCTPGNITSISGKAKVAKSAAIGAFIGATTGGEGDTLEIESANPYAHAVVHIDSEQSPHDHYAVVLRALARARCKKAPEWLESYRICDIPLAQRFDLVEHAVSAARAKHGGIHSVIIDGIADLVASPNDEQEAIATVERLHRLSVEWDAPIIGVIHTNPGSEINKTRGHLGSQLERKAETNLVIEKDAEGISTMYTATSRHTFISKQDGPRYRWDDAAGMHMSVQTERAEKSAQDDDKLRAIAGEAFGARALKYTEATSEIKRVAKVRDARAEGLFTDMKKAGIIVQNTMKFWEVAA